MQHRSTHPSPVDEDDTVSRLLLSAGPRKAAPPAARDAVERAAFSAWQVKVAAHSAARRRWRTGLAAAALLAAALGGVALWQRTATDELAPATAPPVATVAALLAPVSVHGHGEDALLALGDPVAAGSEIRTSAAGRAALTLSTGAVLRLDVDTRLRLDDASRVALEHGAVYVDTGDARGAGADAAVVEVRTPMGVARDVGTRFEVRWSADVLDVKVREGRVDVTSNGRSLAAPAGTALTVRGDGRVERTEILPDHPDWRWIWQAAPAFDIEGHSLAEVLDWVAEETGWTLRYADPELARHVASIVAHGSLDGVTPDLAPDLLLPTAGLSYRVSDGTLWIGRE